MRRYNNICAAVYHIFAYLAYDLFENDSSCGWRKNEAEIKIERISRIQFIINPNWISQKFFTEQRPIVKGRVGGRNQKRHKFCILINRKCRNII